MSTRSERACMLCGIIQPSKRFQDDGCPNCESLLHYMESGNITECTSPSFEGLVALGENNKGSWVARWLRIDSFVAGLYAVKVNGKLPPRIVDHLENNNVIYRPRDGSAED
ncbi:SPT4 [Candida pseudojiufengensis]|uniref:SPT4 n=1 Tax=Candida pseudojiufengensis TaxID=497109 RepID=UPI0022247D88|nr:SPT4 [Candida pseudojiufengensis]KAI5964330.1 SPT4 [Candida pseudojiufengensis]